MATLLPLFRLFSNSQHIIVRSIYQELLQDVTQLQLPLKTAAFFCNFTCAITAMNFPVAVRCHVMCACNLTIASQSYGHTHPWMVKWMTLHLAI